MKRFLSAACGVCVLLFIVSVARAEVKKFAGLTVDEVNKQYEDLKEKGWTPVSVTGRKEGKGSVFDLTWRDDKIGAWYGFVGMTTKEFQGKKEEMSKDGLKLHSTSSWKAGGQEFHAAIWLRPADGRGSWTHKTGSFTHLRGYLWEEKAGKNMKETFRFLETTRTKEYVELHDRGRNMTVRLFVDHYTAKQGKESFHKIFNGKWESQ